MARSIEAFTGYNKNNEGKRIWCFATTESNLMMDVMQRILFERVIEFGYEILTPKEITNGLEYHKNFLNIFETKQKELFINHINKLINEIKEHNMKYILFKIR